MARIVVRRVRYSTRLAWRLHLTILAQTSLGIPPDHSVPEQEAAAVVVGDRCG